MKDEQETAAAEEIGRALSPVARFLGHSLAAALGFAGLALLSLVPVGVVRGLHALGVADLVMWLHGLETMLFIVDVVLFVAVFLAGAIVFLAETYVDAQARIMVALQRRRS
jgi:hypothetical protein